MAISRLATVGLLALLAYAGAAHAEERVGDGAPISPEFAQTLYGRVGPLREPDGCRLNRFDTSRYRITIVLVTPAGAEHFFDKSCEVSQMLDVLRSMVRATRRAPAHAHTHAHA